MYAKIVQLLNDFFQDRWFLDSGSLLGVVRDGCFLKQDKGIDISVIIDDYNSPNLEKCAERLEQLGFIVSRYQWNNITYKYCFAPKYDNIIKYAIDLHFFKKLNDNYLCPQLKINSKSNFKIINLMRGLRKGNIYTDKLEKGLVGWFERIFISLYRDQFHYFRQPMNMNCLTEGNDDNFYMWVIPCHLIKGVEMEIVYGLNILRDCDEYLTYRYANWHIPVNDWVTLRDDGGIAKSSRNEITELLNISH